MVAIWCIASYAFCSLFSITSAVISSRQTFTVGQAVKTTSGTYKGHPSKSKPGVSEYLGMKFGKPPVGPLRFKNPEPFTSSEIYVADKWGDDCPGALSNLVPGTTMANIASMLTPNTTIVSEDCLNLNIWTKPQTGDKSKAVLVWLYGGGFSIGSAKTLLYDGSTLADEEDVIVVTIDYRLSILGYPGGPEGSVDQNPGLVDQRLATEWVKDNIAGFGGSFHVSHEQNLYH
jgi:carboxylesterase type B